jgi:hypothetical protein
MDSSNTHALREQFDRLFDEMVTFQRKKLLNIAREHYPSIGGDDLLNPHDFTKLEADNRFQFEDGMLAGYIAAQMAVRAEFSSAEHKQAERDAATPALETGSSTR